MSIPVNFSVTCTSKHSPTVDATPATLCYYNHSPLLQPLSATPVLSATPATLCYSNHSSLLQSLSATPTTLLLQPLSATPTTLRYSNHSPLLQYSLLLHPATLYLALSSPHSSIQHVEGFFFSVLETELQGPVIRQVLLPPNCTPRQIILKVWPGNEASLLCFAFFPP